MSLLCNGSSFRLSGYSVAVILPELVAKAFKSPSPYDIRNALELIKCGHMREICMEELVQSGASVKDWLELFEGLIAWKKRSEETK